MKIMILFFTSLVIACSHSSSKTKSAESAVYLDLWDDSNVYTITERYLLEGDRCGIAWEVLTKKINSSWGLRLRYFDSLSKLNVCSDFNTQVRVHENILAYVFNKYDAAKFTWVRTPSLKMINPSGEWNNKIKKLAAKNNEWVELTKNYPNHKSGKSPNKLLVEELNENLYIIKDFTNLFLPDFVLNVSNAEKVFKAKMNNKTVFYDAGSYEFAVQK